RAILVGEIALEVEVAGNLHPRHLRQAALGALDHRLRVQPLHLDLVRRDRALAHAHRDANRGRDGEKHEHEPHDALPLHTAGSTAAAGGWTTATLSAGRTLAAADSRDFYAFV